MAKLTKNTKTTTTLTEKGMLNEVGEIVTDVENQIYQFYQICSTQMKLISQLNHNLYQ